MRRQKIGIYNPYLSTMGGGEKVTVAIAELLSADHEVLLIVHDSKINAELSLKKVGDYFKADLSKVKLVRLPKDNLFFRQVIVRLPLPGRFRQLLFVANDTRKLKGLGLDLFVNNLFHSNLPSPVRKGIYMCMFPQRLEKIHKHRGVIYRIYSILVDKLEERWLGDKQEAIDSYSEIVANSEFTKGWIKAYWHKNAKVLYPICEKMNPSKSKSKTILNVGRFFADSEHSHHKKQDVLIDIFKRLSKLHSQGWELHFAGTVASDKKSAAYIHELQKSAEGYPVKFHFNASFSKLAELYGKSPIYWHATGYGSDPKKYPERQEHFGITTVEAMSAGCVPIVFDSAGQRESVEEGKSGYFWKSQEELIRLTEKIATNTALREKLSSAAINRSKIFQKAAFTKRVREIFEPLL